MDNAKQQCIKLNNYTDEVPYLINLSVSGQAMLTVNPDKPNTTEC